MGSRLWTAAVCGAVADPLPSHRADVTAARRSVADGRAGPEDCIVSFGAVLSIPSRAYCARSSIQMTGPVRRDGTLWIASGLPTSRSLSVNASAVTEEISLSFLRARQASGLLV